MPRFIVIIFVFYSHVRGQLFSLIVGGPDPLRFITREKSYWFRVQNVIVLNYTTENQTNTAKMKSEHIYGLIVLTLFATSDVASTREYLLIIIIVYEKTKILILCYENRYKLMFIFFVKNYKVGTLYSFCPDKIIY